MILKNINMSPVKDWSIQIMILTYRKALIISDLRIIMNMTWLENSIGKIKKCIYWKTEKEQICQNMAI